MSFIVELEPETQWIAPWSGDPGRTCVKESARVYKTEKTATAALNNVRRKFPYRDFSRAKIVPV